MHLNDSKLHEKKIYVLRNEQIRAQFVAELEMIPPERRIYLDESGINKYLHREHGRSLRGKKIYGEISGKSFARQSVISALYKGKLLSPMCFEGTCDTTLFNTWMKQMLIPNLIPGQVLILDAESQKLVEAAGCKILFLPPYSPDLNPIEKYWANMKNRVREVLSKVKTLSDALDSVVLSMQI